MKRAQIGILATIALMCFCFILPIQAEKKFTSDEKFDIVEQNSTINFSFSGSYDTASFEGNAWSFKNLILDSSPPTSGYPTYGIKFDEIISISAQNCNVTIVHCDKIGMSSSWLNYTVSGVGSQTFNLYHESIPAYAVQVYEVYVDKVQMPEGDGWTTGLHNGTGGYWLCVDALASQVSVHFGVTAPNVIPSGNIESQTIIIFAVACAIIATAAFVTVFILKNYKSKRKLNFTRHKAKTNS